MGIPLADHNPIRRTPWVNWLLLAINIGVFFFAEPWAGSACEQERFFLQHAAIPHELVSGEALDAAEVQASTSPRCDVAAVPGKPVYLSVLTSMFLHAGLVHLGSNMLFLAIFGNNIEDRLGHLGYLAFDLASGAVATIVFVGANLGSLTTLVGASGAIAGVLGSYLILYPRAPVTVYFPPIFIFRLPALIVLGLWFVLQLGSLRPTAMAGGGVAYLAHVAGFVAGVVLTLLFRQRTRPPPHPLRRRRTYWG